MTTMAQSIGRVNGHGISNASMIAFGYWEQRNNDRWFNQLLKDEAPSFRVPWSSAEEFFVRVENFWSCIRR